MMNRKKSLHCNTNVMLLKFDPSSSISDEDWAALVEVGRLAPSSAGFEPWKMLLLNNKEMKQDLKSMAWALFQCLMVLSFWRVYLARKGREL